MNDARQTALNAVNAWYEANPSAHLGEMVARPLVEAVTAALESAYEEGVSDMALFVTEREIALETAQVEVTRLRAILAYIDAYAPPADATCDAPGITLSEAARRMLRDEGHRLFQEPTP